MHVESPAQRRSQRETATDRLLRAYRQHGDVRVRDRVVQVYLPLVDIFARRYEDAGATYDELMRAGSIGLLCAIQSYVPGRGEEFIGFALPMISEEINAQLRQRVANGAPPNGAPDFDLLDERLQLAGAFRALEPAEFEILELRLAGELSSADVVGRLGMPPEQVTRLTHAALAKLRRKLEHLASGQPPAALSLPDAAAAERPVEQPPEQAKQTHSGRLLLRMPPALHTDLASAARRGNVSLNQFITDTLAAAMGSNGDGAEPRKPAPAPRWLPAAIVTNIVILAIAGILALILLLVAWDGA
jgi:RNA polymerase sigma factor (sigma-70 family)